MIFMRASQIFKDAKFSNYFSILMDYFSVVSPDKSMPYLSKYATIKSSNLPSILPSFYI